MEELKFHLSAFEGPLDLLLKLIMKNKVSIWDIPITLILDQYLEYLLAAEAMEAEVEMEFVAMVATLMMIKSSMMLPGEEAAADEEDPRIKLARALDAYRAAKEAAADLAPRFAVYGGRLVKEPEVIEDTQELAPHDPELLRGAYTAIIRRAVFAVPAEVRGATEEAMIASAIPIRPVSVTGKIIGVMKRLYREGELSHDDIISKNGTRGEMIATFMGVLELLRAGRVKLREDERGTMWFRLVKRGEAEDTNRQSE